MRSFIPSCQKTAVVLWRLIELLSFITGNNLCKFPTISQGTEKTPQNPNQNPSHTSLWWSEVTGWTSRVKRKIDKEKRKVKERENDHQCICCCFLNPSIHPPVGWFYWGRLWFGGPVSKVSRLCFSAVSNDSCVQAGPSSTAPTVRSQNPENQG